MLDPEKKLVYLRLHNERTRARFLLVLQSTIMFSLFLRRRDSFLHLVSKLQGNTSSAKKPASFVSKAPTVSFADSDAARKNDSVDDQSSKSATLKPADLEVEETEKVVNKTLKSPASIKSAPAVLQPRNVQAGDRANKQIQWYSKQAFF